MKLLFVFVALFAFAHGDPATVTIQLGSQPFDEIRNAKLWVYLTSSTSGESIGVLVATDDLLPSKNFTTHLNLPFDPNDIDKATFHWIQPRSITNTTSQSSPKFLRKPVVFLDHVMVTGSYELRWKPRTDTTMKLIPVNEAQAIESRERAELKVDYCITK